MWQSIPRPQVDEWRRSVVLPEFARLHPNVEVDLLTSQDADADRALIEQEGGVVHVFNPNFLDDGYGTLRRDGELENLEPLVERDGLDVSGFDPVVLERFRDADGLWALPFLQVLGYVIYDPEKFDAAGLTYPPTDWEDRSWTWDVFLQQARALQEHAANSNEVSYGASIRAREVESLPLLFGKQIWPASVSEIGTAERVALTDPVAVESRQAYRDMLEFLYADLNEEELEPDPVEAFLVGQLPLLLAQSLYFQALHRLGGDGFCWGVAALPWGSPDRERKSVAYSDPWSIAADLPNDEREAAWALVKLATSHEMQRQYMELTASVPVRTDLLEQWYQELPCMSRESLAQLHAGAVRSSVEVARHSLYKSSKVSAVWNKYFSRIHFSSEPLLPLLQEAEQELNEALRDAAESME